MLETYISYVESFFQKRGVSSPRELCFEELAEENSGTLIFAPRKSHAVTICRPDTIEHLCVVNSLEPECVQRVHTAHEIAHIILHVGIQKFNDGDLQDFPGIAGYAVGWTHLCAVLSSL